MHLFSALEYCRYGMGHSSQKLELPLNSSSLCGKTYSNPSTSFSHHSRYYLVHCHPANSGIFQTRSVASKVVIFPVRSSLLTALHCGMSRFLTTRTTLYSNGLIKTVIIQSYSSFHSRPLAVQLHNILYKL